MAAAAGGGLVPEASGEQDRMLRGLNGIFQQPIQAGDVHQDQKRLMLDKLARIMTFKRGNIGRTQDALRVGIKQGVDTMCELFLDEFTIDPIVNLDDASFREFDVDPREKAIFISNLRLLIKQCVMDQISLPEYTIRMIYTLIWDSPYKLAGEIMGTVASIIIARDVIIYCIETGLLVFTLGRINLTEMIALFNTAYTQCNRANVEVLLTRLGFANPQAIMSYIGDFTKAQLQYFVLTIYLLILKRYSPNDLRAAGGGNLPPPPPPPPPATIVGEVIDILKRLKDGLFSAGGASINQILQIRLAQRPSGEGVADSMIDLLGACSSAAGERGNARSAFLDPQHPRRKVFDGVCCTLNLPVFTPETDEETVGQQLWLLGSNVQTCMTGYLEVPTVVVQGRVQRRIGIIEDSPHRYLTQTCIADLRGKLNTPVRISKLINKFPLCSSLLIESVFAELDIRTVQYDPSDPDSVVVQPGGDSVNQVFIDLPVQVPKPGILCRMATGMAKMWHKGGQMAVAKAQELWPSLEPARPPPANPMRFVEHPKQMFKLRQGRLLLDIERVGDAEQDPSKKPNIDAVKAAFEKLDAVSKLFLEDARSRSCTQVQVSLYDQIKDGLAGVYDAIPDGRAFVERAASIVSLEQLECTIAPFIAGATTTTPTLEDAQSLFAMCKFAVEAVCGLSKAHGDMSDPSDAAKELAAEFDMEGKMAEDKFKDAVVARGNCGGGGAAGGGGGMEIGKEEQKGASQNFVFGVGSDAAKAEGGVGRKTIHVKKLGNVGDAREQRVNMSTIKVRKNPSTQPDSTSSGKGGSKSRKNTKRTRRHSKGRKSSKAAKKTQQRRSSRHRRSSRKGRK
jgi:hypothetical protein